MSEKPERPYNILLEIGPQEYAQWQHNPISAAFLQFMDDQILVWREVAADIVEVGAYEQGASHEDRNLDVVRGKIIAMRQLRGISLEDIQGFYGKEPVVEAEPESNDE